MDEGLTPQSAHESDHVERAVGDQRLNSHFGGHHLQAEEWRAERSGRTVPVRPMPAEQWIATALFCGHARTN